MPAVGARWCVEATTRKTWHKPPRIVCEDEASAWAVYDVQAADLEARGFGMVRLVKREVLAVRVYGRSGKREVRGESVRREPGE